MGPRVIGQSAFLVLVLAQVGPAEAQTPYGVVEVPRTGLTRCYASSGAEIPCYNTRQDGDLQAGVAWPVPRFTVGVGAEAECVTDRLTGLMWPRPAGSLIMTWAGAIDYAINDVNGQGLCGHNDWVLPNISQLETLTHAGLSASDAEAWLSAQGMDRYYQTLAYWSSTSVDSDTLRAWYVQDGQVRHDDKGASKCALPVRVSQPGRLPRTGQVTSYRTGDDGDRQQGVTWPLPRFSENLDAQGQPDGTVTDNLTGLMWLEDANCIRTNYPTFDTDNHFGTPQDGHVTWDHAFGFMLGINAGTYPACGGGHTDWRLPNRKELMGLADRDRSSPALPSGHPFTRVQGLYWTSGPKVQASSAWVFDTADGAAYTDWLTYVEHAVWPVRGGRAGFVRAIAGTVRLDGVGLGGVVVTLNGVSVVTPGGVSTTNAFATTTTAADGTYRFDDLADGNYAIRPGQNGYVFSPPDATVTLAGSNVQLDFSAVSSPTHSIAGTVIDGNTGTGVGGNTLALSGPVSTSTVTANDGSYSFLGLPDGTYGVAASRYGYVLDPSSATVVLVGTNARQDFVATLYSVTVSKTLVDIGALEVGRFAAGRVGVSTTGPATLEVRVEDVDVTTTQMQAVLRAAGYDPARAVSDASAFLPVSGMIGGPGLTLTINLCCPPFSTVPEFYFHPSPDVGRVSVAKAVITAFPYPPASDPVPLAPPRSIIIVGRSVDPGDPAAAPAARDDVAWTSVNTAVTVPVLANDPTRVGRPLYVSMIGGSCYLPPPFSPLCEGDPSNIGGTVSLPSSYDRVIMTPQANQTGTMAALYSASEQECTGCPYYENTMYFARITVTVGMNRPPTAEAGPDQTVDATSATGAEVVLRGTGIDPEGVPLTFAWNGPCGRATTADATFTCPVGISVMTLTVNDGQLTASDTVTITVRQNRPPIAEAGPDQTATATSTFGAEVTLTGSGSDPDGQPLTFAWSGPCGIASTAVATFTCAVGTHVFTLSVSDGQLIGSDTVTVIVNPNLPPTAYAGDDLLVVAASAAGTQVTLTGTGSDPEGQPLSFDWSGPCGTASTATATFACPIGVSEMTLTVSDGLNMGFDSVTVTVVPGPPDVTVRKQVRDPATNLLGSTATVGNGAPVEFSLTVANMPQPGGGPTTGPVTVTDVLPTGLSFVAASSGCGAAGQVVTCTIAGLQTYEEAEFNVFAQVDPALASAGTVVILSNTATVTTPGDSYSRNNTSMATVTVQAPMPLPTGGTVLVTAPWPQTVSNVARSSDPGVNFPFGALSYTVTLGPGETSSSTSLTFTPALAPRITLYKTDGDGMSLGAIPTCNGTSIVQDCWTRQDTLTHTIVVLILTDDGPFDLDPSPGVIADPLLIEVESAIPDTTPPDIALGTPGDGAVYVLGQGVAASFSCSDSESGIAACAGTVPNGGSIDTSSVGTKTLTVTATDAAGNASTVTHTYRVVFAASGPCEGVTGHTILKPIEQDGSTVVRQGRTVPAKFRVCDASGTSIGTPGVVSGFTLSQVLAGTAAQDANIEVPSTTPDTAFRWDPIEHQWIFNIGTASYRTGRTYRFRIVLSDGSAIDFSFGVR